MKPPLARSVTACVLLLVVLSGCSGSGAASQQQTQTAALRADLAAANAEVDRLEAENAALDRQLREAQQEVAQALGVKGDLGETVAELVADELFVGGGTARLTSAGRARLDEVAERLRAEYPGRIVRIEGHSDDDPISTSRFPSNWDLSSARASAVAAYLEGAGFDGITLEVVGLAEHHPVAGNETAAGKRQNRRVRIAALGG